jgi:hypothetical protein
MNPSTFCMSSGGGFFLVGLFGGAWKYLCILRSLEARSPLYVDLTHRSALLYAFARVLLSRLCERNAWPDGVNSSAAIVSSSSLRPRSCLTSSTRQRAAPTISFASPPYGKHDRARVRDEHLVWRSRLLLADDGRHVPDQSHHEPTLEGRTQRTRCAEAAAAGVATGGRMARLKSRCSLVCLDSGARSGVICPPEPRAGWASSIEQRPSSSVRRAAA